MTALVAALGSSALTGIVAVILAVLGQRNARSLLQDERTSRTKERREDQAEWYRHAVYERRLVAFQDAHAWISRLNVAISRAKAATPTDPANQALIALAQQARDWYDANALWFQGGLPTSSSFVGLCNAAAAYAFRDDVDVWKAFIEADQALRARADELLAESPLE